MDESHERLLTEIRDLLRQQLEQSTQIAENGRVANERAIANQERAIALQEDAIARQRRFMLLYRRVLGVLAFFAVALITLAIWVINL